MACAATPPPEVQHQLSSVGDELGGSVHDFLEYGANAAAFGRVPNRRDVARQAELPYQAQTVVGKGGQLQDGVVGIKPFACAQARFPGRQPLQIPIGLELGVILLMQSMVLVQRVLSVTRTIRRKGRLC